MRSLEKNKRALNILGLVIFIAGVLIGFIFDGFLTWGGLEGAASWGDPAEANNFAHVFPSDTQISNFRCPLIMTPQETSTVSATFTNTGKEPTDPVVRLYAGQRPTSERLNLKPGESRPMNWSATINDIAYGRFVLIRLLMYDSYPLVANTYSCGILVVNLPFLSGFEITAVIMVISLLLMVAGFSLWANANQPLRDHVATQAVGMIVLVLALVAGAFFSIQAWATPALLIFLLCVLLLLGIFGEMLRAS